MAITFPRTLLPGLNITDCMFMPRYNVARSRDRAGELLRVQTGWHVWEITLIYQPMYAHQSSELLAWYDSMRGGMGSFLAHDTARPLPVDYRVSGLSGLTRAGGGAFDGTATVAALSAFELQLSTLPDGFSFRAGDMVGLVEGGKYDVHRIVADAVADGSGNVTLDVYPAVNLFTFSTSAVANLDKPVVEFVPVDIKASPSLSAQPVSISGVQRR
jgi:hypothetical protein